MPHLFRVQLKVVDGSAKEMAMVVDCREDEVSIIRRLLVRNPKVRQVDHVGELSSVLVHRGDLGTLESMEF